MKEKIKTILLLSIFIFIGNYFLLTIFPKTIRNVFSLESNITNKFIVGILVRTIGIIIMLFIIKKFKIKYNCKFHIKYLIISSVFIIYILFNIELVQLKSDMYFNLFLMIIEALSIGFYEELIFRGIAFKLLEEKFKNKNILIPILISSVMFGLIHFFNFKNGYSFSIILYQVLYTAIIGFSLNSIFIRTNYNIIFCSILHALYDIASGFESLLPNLNSTYDIDLSTFISGITLFIPLLIYSLFIIRKIKPSKN